MNAPGHSLAPTLSRLSFWVPAARRSEFETAYESRLAPLLKKHGLVESPERGRPTTEGVLSRLFAVEGPAAIAEKQEALVADPQWMAALKELGASFGAVTPDGLLRHRLGLYRAPAGPGQILREVRAQGYWRTYGEARNVTSICQDRQGHLWLGTRDRVTCYDGHQWTFFTSQDGLVSTLVSSVLEDREGNLWFGTAGGVSRYDGKSWITFTTKDGLASNTVGALCQDQQGRLWFGTGEINVEGRGVSCYDGQRWTTFTTQDGLPAPWVTAVFQDQQGHLWFGTFNGGVCCCDGQVFQVLDQRDGLAGNLVWGIHQDGQGRLWFTTENGATCYRPSALEPPGICIDAVIANRRYEDFADLILPSHAGLAAFEFHGTSLTARPGALVFRYRLEGCDAEWRTTRAGHVEYPDLSPGLYTFQVQAVDQRMQYSSLAEVRFRVRDPQEEQIEELEEQVRARTRELEEKNRQLEAANRALEQANQQIQQATHHKSQFLSRMSHDFEEFRQSRRQGEGEKQGSGLGLAIARKSVELLGGSIAVESQVGKGAKFTLRIRDYEG